MKTDLLQILEDSEKENMPYELRKEFDSKWRRHNNNLMCDLICEWIEKNFVSKELHKSYLQAAYKAGLEKCLELLPKMKESTDEDREKPNESDYMSFGYNKAIEEFKEKIMQELK